MSEAQNRPLRHCKPGASLAQWLSRWPRNASVVGSIPVRDYFISFFSFELFSLIYATYSVKTCLTLISHFCALKKINTSPYNTLIINLRLDLGLVIGLGSGLG